MSNILDNFAQGYNLAQDLKAAERRRNMAQANPPVPQPGMATTQLDAQSSNRQATQLGARELLGEIARIEQNPALLNSIKQKYMGRIVGIEHLTLADIPGAKQALTQQMSTGQNILAQLS